MHFGSRPMHFGHQPMRFWRGNVLFLENPRLISGHSPCQSAVAVLRRWGQLLHLRRISELALMSRAEAWWPEWRERSDFSALTQGLLSLEPLDPATEPPEPLPDPWAGLIPPPDVWLAREAWWRTGGAAGSPEQ